MSEPDVQEPPYLCYSRKDMRTKPRDPVTMRYLAELFEAVGASRIDVLPCAPLLAAAIQRLHVDGSPVELER